MVSIQPNAYVNKTVEVVQQLTQVPVERFTNYKQATQRELHSIGVRLNLSF